MVLDPDDRESVRAALQELTGAHGMSAVTTYEGWRERPDGSPQEFTVEVWDGGPEDPLRWRVVARAKDGQAGASGNAADRLDTALALVHWWDLNK